MYVTDYRSKVVYRILPSGKTSVFVKASGAEGITFDRFGNFYVADYDDYAIYKFTSTGTSLGSFPSGLPYPQLMTCDTNGNLYVACTTGATNNAIKRFAPDGTPLLSWTSPNLSVPDNVKFGPDGNLYVSDASGNVCRFSSTGVDMGDFITGLSNPLGLAFKPVPVSPVTVSGTVAFEGIVPTAPVQNVTFEFRVFGVKAFASQTVAVAPDGGFSLSNVPRGNYSLHIKGDKYLAKNVNVDATGGSIAGVTAALPAGDANNDNSVDSTDFGLLIGAFDSDSTIPGSGYDARADFNGDGFVDSTDFGLLIGNFNETGDK